jgi:hypothetical protein
LQLTEPEAQVGSFQLINRHSLLIHASRVARLRMVRIRLS